MPGWPPNRNHSKQDGPHPFSQLLGDWFASRPAPDNLIHSFCVELHRES
jgi:hypothetical protein